MANNAAEVLEVSSDEIDLNDTSSPVVDRIIEAGKMGRDDEQKQHAKDLLQVFATEMVNQKLTFKKDFTRTINERIADLDALLGQQINEILHHPEFQKLESSWRGLEYLVKTTEPDEQLQIKILDATKEDLIADADSAADFDQSGLFKLVYEEEYGTFGGTPFGLLVGDYYFGKGYTDLNCLKAVSKVAAAAHAPFVASTAPDLFNLDTFADLQKPKSLEKIFSSTEFSTWNSFRSTEEAKYVSLTLPRMVMRLPYGASGIPVRDFSFEETCDGTDDSKYLWGNIAFAKAQRIAQSFREFGWFQAIRGVENGGAVTELPLHTYVDSEGNKASKVPVEVMISDRREKELDDLGFLPLVYKRGTDMGVFFGSKTVHKIKTYESDAANANAQLTIQLPYLMSVSRFAHYMKVIMRDKIGSFASQSQVDSYLNRWISQYVILDDNAPQIVKAKYPLREARVDVVSVPGKVGAYKAVMFLRPHFYLNDLSISMRLVTDLPAKK